MRQGRIWEFFALSLGCTWWRGETQVNLFTPRPVKTPFVFIDQYLISWPIYCDYFTSCPPTHFLAAPIIYIFIHGKNLWFLLQGGFLVVIPFSRFLFGYGCALYSNQVNELSLLFFYLFLFYMAPIGFWRNFIGYCFGWFFFFFPYYIFLIKYMSIN